MKRRKIAAALATLGTVGVLGLAPQASAGEPTSLRPIAVEGRFWIYEWPNYTGRFKSYNTDDFYFYNDEWDGTSGESVDNLASSAHNNTDRWARLYQFGNDSGGGCSGDYVEFAPGAYARDLGQLNNGTFNFNNKASCIIFDD
ncbi:peptidase inhibitor family I36 protein [Streptomyces sp. NPDC050433]|uniref:peptidase inhibitor family I36 protein n=1 Tax=Streptomyces sp. NPDC050433 TaxID=3365615 RepID=UPI00379F3A61